MDFIIKLDFVSDDPFWFRERMPQWWQRFAELGGDDWQRWLHENRFLAEPPLPDIDDLQMQGNEVKVVLHTGSDGVDTAPMLVAMLYKANCTGVEALLFSDEAEVIVDEEGKTHFMGLRYYINEDGKLAVADYPEIEYIDE